MIAELDILYSFEFVYFDWVGFRNAPGPTPRTRHRPRHEPQKESLRKKPNEQTL